MEDSVETRVFSVLLACNIIESNSFSFFERRKISLHVFDLYAAYEHNRSCYDGRIGLDWIQSGSTRRSLCLRIAQVHLSTTRDRVQKPSRNY